MKRQVQKGFDESGPVKLQKPDPAAENDDAKFSLLLVEVEVGGGGGVRGLGRIETVSSFGASSQF